MIEPQLKRQTNKFPILAEDGTAPQLVQVWDDVQGFQHLRCACPIYTKKLWCPHVQLIYTSEKELDAGTLSATVGVQISKPPRALTIPILILNQKMVSGEGRVRQVGGHTKVVKGFTKRKADERLCEVQAIFGDIKNDTIAGSIEGEGTYPLGFIVKGVHGRKTLRRMALDWLMAVPTLYPAYMKCTATTHKPGDSWLDQGVTRTSQLTPTQMEHRRITDGFCLIDSHKCYSCLEVVQIASDLPFRARSRSNV